MDYVVRLGTERRAVRVDEDGGDAFVLTLDGEQVRATVVELGHGELLVSLPDYADARFLLHVEPGCASWGGFELSGEVLDLRTLALEEQQQKSAADAPQVVTTPMPGRVAAVLVAEGQKVEAGDGLVVVEAMKMENELRAPRAGVVRDLAATQGASVAGGAILCAVH